MIESSFLGDLRCTSCGMVLVTWQYFFRRDPTWYTIGATPCLEVDGTNDVTTFENRYIGINV